MTRGIRVATRAALAAALALTLAAAAHAADYVLGAEDEIAIAVWMHPELERRVTVATDGKIVVPPIGEIVAAGSTAKQLADRIADRLSTFIRQTVTVNVTVTKFMSRSVTVTGAVAAPGRYGFADIPSVVDVINAAGGAVPGSDLTRVQIIRKEGDDRGTVVADVTNALRSGVADNLPRLKPGDTIVVQSFVGAYAPAPGDGFAVLGEVMKPGIYQSGAVTNVWLALAQAGGLRERGDLARIKLVSVGTDGQQVTDINLKNVLKNGGTAPPLVKPGDVVYVLPTTSSGAAKGWTALTQTLALTRDLVNIVIIADYIDKRK